MGVADCPFDQERLGGVGEQPFGGGQHLQRAGLVPAVPAVMRGVPDRRVLPVQRVQGREDLSWRVSR
jgi:hypothetical protein